MDRRRISRCIACNFNQPIIAWSGSCPVQIKSSAFARLVPLAAKICAWLKQNEDHLSVPKERVEEIRRNHYQGVSGVAESGLYCLQKCAKKAN